MNTTSSAGSTTRCIAIARAPCAPRVSTMSSGSNASPSSALNERGGLLGDAIRHVVGEPSTVLGNAPSLQRLHVPMQSWELGVPGYEVARLRVAAVPAQLGGPRAPRTTDATPPAREARRRKEPRPRTYHGVDDGWGGGRLPGERGVRCTVAR